MIERAKRRVFQALFFIIYLCLFCVFLIMESQNCQKYDINMNADQKYAVVHFVEDDLKEISVIPTTWLIDETKCYWPKASKNLRTQIIKRVLPSTDWPTYICKIASKYDSYEEALEGEKLEAASSQSEDETRKGKRKLKPRNMDIYEFPTLTIERDSSPKSFTSTSSASGKNFNQDNYSNDDDLSNDLSDQINSAGITENVNKTITNNIENVPVVMINNDYKLLVDTVFKIQATVDLILQRVNNLEINNRAESSLSDEKIKYLIPAATIEALFKIEQLVKEDEEASRQLFNKLCLVGGSDYKNATKRCLCLIYTNKLAMICSWTGQKNNFKVGDLQIMAILKRAIATNFKQTDKEFELCVMEWFRFAKQRHSREETEPRRN